LDTVVTGSIRLDIPSSPRYVSLARLITGSLARGLNFSEEGVDDLKIVISEMCTNAIIHCSFDSEEVSRVNVRYFPGKDSITIEVQDQGQGFDPDCVGNFEDGLEAGKGFGIPLIKSLVDVFELETDKDRGTTIRVTKYEQPEQGLA
jgi:serine/threonine-protein kinase RsbW